MLACTVERDPRVSLRLSLQIGVDKFEGPEVLKQEPFNTVLLSIALIYCIERVPIMLVMIEHCTDRFCSIFLPLLEDWLLMVLFNLAARRMPILVDKGDFLLPEGG